MGLNEFKSLNISKWNQYTQVKKLKKNNANWNQNNTHMKSQETHWTHHNPNLGKFITLFLVTNSINDNENYIDFVKLQAL